jgi:hypothetical protein
MDMLLLRGREKRLNSNPTLALLSICVLEFLFPRASISSLWVRTIAKVVVTTSTRFETLNQTQTLTSDQINVTYENPTATFGDSRAVQKKLH